MKINKRRRSHPISKSCLRARNKRSRMHSISSIQVVVEQLNQKNWKLLWERLAFNHLLRTLKSWLAGSTKTSQAGSTSMSSLTLWSQKWERRMRKKLLMRRSISLTKIKIKQFALMIWRQLHRNSMKQWQMKSLKRCLMGLVRAAKRRITESIKTVSSNC